MNRDVHELKSASQHSKLFLDDVEMMLAIEEHVDEDVKDEALHVMHSPCIVDVPTKDLIYPMLHQSHRTKHGENLHLLFANYI